MREKGYKGGFIPRIRREERMRDPMEMFQKTRLKTAYFAKKYALKFRGVNLVLIPVISQNRELKLGYPGF
jgi:hypothetical protein